MQEATDLLYNVLKNNGWNIEQSHTDNCDLPENIQNRYNNIPTEYIEFLTHIRICVNPDETVWLLCVEDFKQESEDSFRWNEFELIGLQAASEEKDVEWQKDIKAFWDNHLPICLSIHSGYEYYAIRMNDGHIVHGFEPEFELPSEVADSFYKFAEMISDGKIDL